MKENIDAILFDMGGTLRSTNRPLPQVDHEKIREMILLLGVDYQEVGFIKLLQARARAYKSWAEKTLLELNEIDLWRQWMLPELPPDRVSRLAFQLNELWRDATVRHTVFPETQATVQTLFRRGYRLGLVSNTTSSVELPRFLGELGIAGCFDVVILSCVVGIRKPDPKILLMAAAQIGVIPERCGYIGDQPRRDVAAARNAGFGLAVILNDPDNPDRRLFDPLHLPDHSINNLKELSDLFPPLRTLNKPASNNALYDASLSTMWGMKNFASFYDFLLAAPRLGFAKIELNHQVSPAMLAGIDLKRFEISSIHEPCPAATSASELKKQDLLISSPDATRRQEGINSIKRSLDLAAELGCGVIVVHCGQVQGDTSIESQLKSLFTKHQIDSPEYHELKERFSVLRASLVGPYLEALRKSLLELLDYAGRFNIRLGIENRFHYFDIPTFEEMGEILDLAGPERLGFLYDIGHAQVQDRLGFSPHQAWLDGFAGRIIGVHIHDVLGIQDHLAPGLGEVDFRKIAPYLPQDAFRTIEISPANTPEQIKDGMKNLVDAGCVNLLEGVNK